MGVISIYSGNNCKDLHSNMKKQNLALEWYKSSRLGLKVTTSEQNWDVIKGVKHYHYRFRCWIFRLHLDTEYIASVKIWPICVISTMSLMTKDVFGTPDSSVMSCEKATRLFDAGRSYSRLTFIAACSLSLNTEKQSSGVASNYQVHIRCMFTFQ